MLELNSGIHDGSATLEAEMLQRLLLRPHRLQHLLPLKQLQPLHLHRFPTRATPPG